MVTEYSYTVLDGTTYTVSNVIINILYIHVLLFI